jgi:hypothetical protein
MAQLLAAAATVGAVWVALRLQDIRDRRSRPVLAIRHEMASRFLLKTPARLPAASDQGGGAPASVQREYFRVQVENIGVSTAKDSRAYLLKVERFEDGAKAYRPIFEDTIPVAWSFIFPGPSGGGLDLPRRLPHYLNVGWAEEGSDEFRLDLMPRPVYVEGLIREQGQYRLTIHVTAEGAQGVTQTFDLLWRGGINTSALSMLPGAKCDATAGVG